VRLCLVTIETTTQESSGSTGTPYDPDSATSCWIPLAERRSMLRLLTLAVLAFVLISAAAMSQAATPSTPSWAPAAGPPASDQFYVPPSPLSAGEPGTLIRWAPMPAPPGIRAWRILYHSTDMDGGDVAVSGAVFAPDLAARPDGFPLIAMGHNTTGIARVCAPSLDPFRPLAGAAEAFYAQQVAGFVDGGFVVVATDYQGLGAVDGNHPFLIGESAAYNVLDAARAARALPDLDLAPDTTLWGHSQGGHAAAWAGQFAPTYAPDLRVTGVILGAPAAEPGLVLAAASGQPEPTPLTGYIVSLAYAWSHVYPEVAAAPALTPAALEKIDIVTRECIPTIATAYGDRPLADYVDAALLMAAPWAALLERNAAGRQPIGAPVLVVQGTDDPLVPAPTTEAFVDRLCGLGTDVQMRLYPDVGHGAVITAAMPDMLAWAAARRVGKAEPSTCGSAARGSPRAPSPGMDL
jgi:pimeloyl-ACP methyl ester carboxylesterase